MNQNQFWVEKREMKKARIGVLHSRAIKLSSLFFVKCHIVRIEIWCVGDCHYCCCCYRHCCCWYCYWYCCCCHPRLCPFEHAQNKIDDFMSIFPRFNHYAARVNLLKNIFESFSFSISLALFYLLFCTLSLFDLNLWEKQSSCALCVCLSSIFRHLLLFVCLFGLHKKIKIEHFTYVCIRTLGTPTGYSVLLWFIYALCIFTIVVLATLATTVTTVAFSLQQTNKITEPKIEMFAYNTLCTHIDKKYCTLHLTAQYVCNMCGKRDPTIYYTPDSIYYFQYILLLTAEHTNINILRIAILFINTISNNISITIRVLRVCLCVTLAKICGRNGITLLLLAQAWSFWWNMRL